jgi:Ca2+-binding RTX toxin-like protein
MVFRKAARASVKAKLVALTMLILAVTAGTALAANITGNGTLVGTTGADNIAAGNGDDTVWGLGGGDNITAGNGNDVIDADGMCPKGLAAGDYPNGLPGSNYCEHGHDGVPGNHANIAVGSGDDTIYGGGGTNSISVGNGNDTIYGGPVGDTISAGSSTGMGNDKIYLDYNDSGAYYTGSTVYTGAGDDVVYAQNGKKDTIVCPRSNGTTVYADTIDSVKNCHRVIYTSSGLTSAVRRAASHASSKRATTHKKASKKTTSRRTRTHKRTQKHVTKH